MVEFSTDHLPRRDRFAYWREGLTRYIGGVEAEIEPDRSLDFAARITLAAVGSATLMEVAARAHMLRPSGRPVRGPEDDLLISHTLRDSGLIIAGGHAERVLGGTVMTMGTGTAYTYRPGPGLSGEDAGEHYRMIRIPVARLLGERKDLNGEPIRQHAGTAGLDVLLRSYAGAFFEQAPHLTGEAAEHAVRTLAQLALAARGAVDPRDERSTAAIRAGLLTRARRLIERDLHRADLTPARVAAELGVSVRGLHLAFAPTGESFGRHLLARRLARADRMMRENPHLSVTQAAYACGFEGLSTFFRGYRAAYGASPGSRRAVATARGSGPVDPD